ncbi:hypothetical protein JXA85_04110 [Candidatus Woesearchaeota archaeon]|nr:hypothetical protein [Candidatus Woesearchaeota archaeon]
MEFITQKREESNWSEEIELTMQKVKKKEEMKEYIKKKIKEINVTYSYSLPKEAKVIIPSQSKSYLTPYFVLMQESRKDTTRFAESKRLEVQPKAFMPGVLGYTILGWRYQVLRDDLIGEKKEMVDLHESIHTNDEYETRVLTSWMLGDFDEDKYRVKYGEKAKAPY